MIDLRKEIKEFMKENGFAESFSTVDLLETKMNVLGLQNKLDVGDINQVKAFLSSNAVKDFCKKQQPLMDPVPEEVIKEINNYFKDDKNSLSRYTPLAAYRSSNAKGDSHLYSILAKRQDGTYSCWTSYNTSLHSMNNGHYGLTKEEALKVLKSNFFDITDCPAKYGIENSEVKINEDKTPEKVVNIASARARRGR